MAEACALAVRAWALAALGLEVRPAEMLGLGEWHQRLEPWWCGLCGAAGSANSWAGQLYGVGPHVQDWFWVGLALARTNTDISSLPYKTP